MSASKNLQLSKKTVFVKQNMSLVSTSQYEQIGIDNFETENENVLSYFILHIIPPAIMKISVGLQRNGYAWVVHCTLVFLIVERIWAFEYVSKFILLNLFSEV